MDYVSPFDPRTADPVTPAPRPDSLEGRRVVLLDIRKNRGAEFLDRIAELLTGAGATTFKLEKETFSKPASREVIDRVPIHGDLVVEGLAD
jgi:hypothetical protein